MSLTPEKIVETYTEAYQKLYNRKPKDLRLIDSEWVVVNGARMRVTDLQYLTEQLRQEYRQGLASRRSIVTRLVRWIKGM